MKKNYLKHASFGLLVVVLVVLAFSTIAEKMFCREFAEGNIYGAWWFVILWGTFGVVSLAYIIRRKLYRQKAAFLLHCAFVLILIGAFVTFAFADRGYVHLRQGKPANEYTSDDELSKKPLPFEIRLVLFEIEYHPGSEQPADFISFLQIDGEMTKVSMNKIHVCQNYRLYQISYDPDEMGSTLLVSHDVYGIAITYLGYLLLAISIFWLLWIRIGWKGILYTLIPTAILWVYISKINPMTPILRTPMLATHVSVIMLSYALFLFITVTGVIGLFSQKRRERLYRLNSTLLYPALFLLALGIFIGAVWANISWGRYWGWDAKETWALITMLVYALPMHKKSLPMFADPYRFHLFCVLAFLTVLMTFLGVSFLLGGIHSYI